MTTKKKKSVAQKRSRDERISEIRIFVVDDHPIVRHGLAQLIDRMEGFTTCGEAGSVSDTMRAMRDCKPDVVAVDMTLDDGSGLELIKQLRDYDPSIKVIVVTMHDEEIYAERATRAGALGYVKKSKELERITEGIRDIIQRRLALSPAMKDRIVHRATGTLSEEVSDTQISDRLSDRELQVFEQIGKGLTTQEIAGKLHVSVKTVDTHRERVRMKLGLRHRNDVIRHAVMWVEKVIQ